MQTLFVDHLSVIDFAYFHPQHGIVGESLILDVELSGELNDEGMLFDFSFVKKRIKSCVDNLVDHKLLVAKNDPTIKITETPQQLIVDLHSTSGLYYQHLSPPEAVCFIENDKVTPNSIAKTIQFNISKILPNNVTQVKINLRAEKNTEHYYHYSHGLKKHFGDCQRIAHGHRSNIQIWIDNTFSNQWSKHIAELWENIYLATKEDLIEKKVIKGTHYLVFQYHANQGLFKLTIPESQCHLIESDTTVELLANYLAHYIKSQNPDASSIKVKAFEGVDKGAIAILNGTES